MIINKLIKNNKRIKDEVSKAMNIRNLNSSLFNNANKSTQIFDNVQDKSSEWENMIAFVDDEGVTTFLYKQWDIALIDYEAEDAEKYFNLINPNLTYNVLYREATANDIKMYSTGLELNHVGFLDVQETSLHLKVSAYIKKYFDSAILINPEVKLNLIIRNNLKILH